MNKDRIEKQLLREAQERMDALKLNDLKLKFFRAGLVKPVGYALYVVQNLGKR
jgi:hypothetical protein